MELGDDDILNEIINCKELSEEWKYDEIGTITVGYEELNNKYPPNEINNKIIYVYQKSIGLFFELVGRIYKIAIRNIDTYPLHCSTICLMINADCSIAWNRRFELKLNKTSELFFTKCLSMKFKKGFLIYHYREMLLTDKGSILTKEDSLEEFHTTINVISRYSRGYHLYKHLLWLLGHCTLIDLFDSITKWSESIIVCDQSDYSVMVLRKRIIEKLYSMEPMDFNYKFIQKEKQDIDFLICEYIWISTIIHMIPGHESLWLYHFTLSQMIKLMSKDFKKNGDLFSFEKYFETIYENVGEMKLIRFFTEKNSQYFIESNFNNIDSVEIEFINYEETRTKITKCCSVAKKRLQSSVIFN